MKITAKWYIESFIKINTKDSKVKNLRLNTTQKRLYNEIKRLRKAKKPVRIIILKARQMGFSTFTEALIFYDTVTHENVTSGIVAHTTDSATNLFKMSKLFYDELPCEIKPMLKGSNAKELIFENPARRTNDRTVPPGLRSKIKCSTASGNGVGRGDTLTNVHISEYAFWEGDKRSTLTGLLQAVPNLPDTMVIIESTANGFDDFKDMWDSAVNKESDFVPLFFPWFEMKEYRMKYDGTPLSDEEKELKRRFGLDDEQIAWRRWCLKNNCGGDLNRFRQEYPSTPEEAFIMSGESVFDKEKLIAHISSVKAPLKRGRFVYDYDGNGISNIRWEDCEKGEISIYEEPFPNRPYVIGGDTAGEGSDYFTAHVLDNTSGK
ncbi:MAG: hypothetical protein IJS94_05305 [Clostridia bacterium]|nr:hypothetical protein [Clostridia bacterium]